MFCSKCGSEILEGCGFCFKCGAKVDISAIKRLPNLEKNKNIAIIIAAVFLYLAILGIWPYGFFTFLRFVVCATMAYVAWMAYKSKQEKWVWIFGSIAVIFNPLIPIYLSGGFWSVIDFIVATFLLISKSIFKLEK